MIQFDTKSYKERPGTITNQEVISKYSVMSDGRVLNDPSNARNLNSKHIEDQDDTRFDYGVPGFKYQIDTLNSEPCLHPLCNWAIAQKGATLKEVFVEAEFVASRGTMRTIAYSIVNNFHFFADLFDADSSDVSNPSEAKDTSDDKNSSDQSEHLVLAEASNSWTLVAQKFGGVILLSGQSKGDCTHDEMNHVREFKEWMTTGINDRVDEDSSDDSEFSDVSDSSDISESSFDARNTFEMMVRSTLSVCSESLTICVAAKIDALRGADSIELAIVEKDTLEDAEKGEGDGRSEWSWDFDNIGKVLECEMAGVKSIVFGVKESPKVVTRNGIELDIVHNYVTKVFEKSLEDLKAGEGGWVGEKTAEGYSLLFTVLSEVKQFLESHDACEITVVPTSDERKPKRITLKKISREDANAKGHGVTDDFIDRFKLRSVHQAVVGQRKRKIVDE